MITEEEFRKEYGYNPIDLAQLLDKYQLEVGALLGIKGGFDYNDMQERIIEEIEGTKKQENILKQIEQLLEQ